MTEIQRWRGFKRRSSEDACLMSYGCAAGGVIFTEVPVGGGGSSNAWPPGSKVRRIDGVRLVTEESRSEHPVELRSFDPEFADGFRRQVAASTELEIVEVKTKLNRPVIGQVLAGALMFAREYGVQRPAMCIVYRIPDPALEIVCAELGIELYRALDPAW